MRRALVLALLVLTAGLAGCAGTEEVPGPDAGDGDDPQPQGTPLPTWELGDAWTYRLTDEAWGKQTVRLLNYKDDGAHYWLGAETKRQTVLHAIYSTIPVMGRIHTTNLAPHENGTHAAQYEFPLHDGKEWTGPLYGYQFTFKATEVDDLQTPVGKSHGYLIEGKGPRAQINFDYADTVNWFTDLVLSTSDGTELLRIELVDYDRGVGGEYHFMRADDFAKVEVGNTGPGGASDRFEVPASPDHHLLYAGVIGSYRGQVSVELVDPQGSVQASWSEGSLTGGDGRVVEPVVLEVEDPATGQWTLRYSSSGNSDLDVWVAGVKQYDRGLHQG